MVRDTIPLNLDNFINGEFTSPHTGTYSPKLSPHDNRTLWHFANSSADDVATAAAAALQAQKSWSEIPGVERGRRLFGFVKILEAHKELIASTVAIETGKTLKDAEAETDGAIALARFFAGEGQRLYGRTTQSGISGRLPMTIRQPIGVAGLIVPANTPIANIAWKVFPALICGNTVVLKSAEHSPAVAWLFSSLTSMTDLPGGVVNVVHGTGADAGRAVVEEPQIGVVSFTGSTTVGKEIAEVCGRLLKRVSLELGGKNAFVVCDDADLENALHWSLLSAFSNAGQRCAAGSRLIVQSGIFDEFVAKFVSRCESMTLGISDADIGPMITREARDKAIRAVQQAQSDGAKLLVGGTIPASDELRAGNYLLPTALYIQPDSHPLILDTELFGPIVTIQKTQTYDQALSVASSNPYGLTAAIHTRDWNRALHFAHKIPTGVASINGGTFGSEPHMPFGGRGLSGNGTREPGTEALDIYSELKVIYMNFVG
jgi:acyl-CoA reductase-like NAD-dependent aldehyde dehydrogenase